MSPATRIQELASTVRTAGARRLRTFLLGGAFRHEVFEGFRLAVGAMNGRSQVEDQGRGLIGDGDEFGVMPRLPRLASRMPPPSLGESDSTSFTPVPLFSLTLS